MKKLFILFFVIGLLISCSKEEKNSSARLTGNYSLREAACFCFFEPEMDFSGYKLNFNEKENTLTFIQPSEYSQYFITQPGTYQYSIDNDILTIHGIQPSYKYKIEGNILTLIKIDAPQIADDELTLVYSLN